MTTSTVRMTVPADPAYAVVARTAAASLAAGIGATVEGVEDLRIIVSEAFSVVLASVPSDITDVAAGVDIALSVEGSSIAFEVAGPCDAAIDRSSFAWTILDALVDALDGQVSPHEGRQRLRVTGRTRLHVPA